MENRSKLLMLLWYNLVHFDILIYLPHILLSWCDIFHLASSPALQFEWFPSLQFHPSGSTPDMSIITKAGPKRKIRGTGNRTKAWQWQRHFGAHQCSTLQADSASSQNKDMLTFWGSGYNKDGCGQPERVIGKLGNQNWGRMAHGPKKYPKKTKPLGGICASLQCKPYLPHHSLQSKAFQAFLLVKSQ